MPGRPVASNAVRSAISTASSPVTPSFAGRGSASRSRTVTSASARSPSACTTSCSRQASRIRGLRCPSAATPKPPVRSSSSRPSASVTRQPSARAQITRAEPQDAAGRRLRDRPRHRRVLLQPPQRVAVPLLAERDVDPQPVPLRDELVAPLLAHAEQHLQLVLERLEAAARDPRQRLPDQPLVVRRDPDVAPGVEQRVEAADEVRAHRLEVGERDRRRLEVDALAEPHARPEIRECADVVERPAQPRLEHDADVVVPVLAQLAVEPQRLVGRRRVLHVDPDEVAVAGRGAHDLDEVLAAEVVRELEPERGELDADVRVERGLVDRREHVAVRLGDRARLVLVRDLLAEHVDGRHLPAAFSSRTHSTASASVAPAM